MDVSLDFQNNGLQEYQSIDYNKQQLADPLQYFSRGNKKNNLIQQEQRIRNQVDDSMKYNDRMSLKSRYNEQDYTSRGSNHQHEQNSYRGVGVDISREERISVSETNTNNQNYYKQQYDSLYREYKNLKYNYQNMEKQFELLNQDYSLLNEKQTNSENLIRDKSQEITKLQDERMEFYNDNQVISNEIGKFKKQIDEKNEQIKQIEKKFTNLEIEMISKTNSYKSYKAQIEGLEEENREMVEKINNYDKMKNENQEIHQQLLELSEHSQMIQSQNIAIRDEITALAQIYNEVLDQKSKQDDDFQHLIKEFVEMKESYENNLIILKETKKDNEKIREEFNQLTLSYEKNMFFVQEHEHVQKALEQKIQHLSQVNDDQKKRIEKDKQRQDIKDQQNMEQSQLFENQLNQIKQLQNEILINKNTIAEFTDQINQINKDLKEKNEEFLNILQQNQSIQIESQMLENTNTQLQQLNQFLTTENKNVKQLLDEKTLQYDTLYTKHLNDEKDSMTVHECKEKLQTQQIEINALIIEIEQHILDKESLNKRTTHLEQYAENMKNNIEVWKQTCEKMTLQMQDYLNLKSIIKSLEIENQNIKDDKENIKWKIDEIEQKYINLKKKIVQAKINI